MPPKNANVLLIVVLQKLVQILLQKCEKHAARQERPRLEPKHLYTIRWTQPYATSQLRPYLRGLHEQLERSIEHYLTFDEFPEAKSLIEKIKNDQRS